MSQNDIIIRTHYKSPHSLHIDSDGNDSNLLIVFYVQIMPD
ncbi:hypothetical protein, partial [Escherichia coli]